MKQILPLACAAIVAACTATPPAPPPPPPPPAPAVASIDWFSYDGHDAVYDAKKAGPKEFLNPIRQGYYPDPSVMRVGEDYYLVNSTFVHFPGLPVFHSKDLVHWTQIGNAIDRPNQVDLDKLEVSRGLYAPQISYHDGLFYIINTCVNCGGNFLITAKDPAGPWSDPVWLSFGGIDPSLFFDTDGKVYVVHNDVPPSEPQWEGHRALWMQEYDLVAKKMIGPHKVVVDGGVDVKSKPVWIEGPHLYKVKGWYYLMAAEGGTGLQHSQVIFRSKKVWGPYAPWKNNPILTQRDLYPAREFPVTATGHADLVQTQKGAWWAVFLGTRPYGLSSEDYFNTGRETFLLPVTWKNGWPVILKKGEHLPFVVKRPDLPYDASPITGGNFGYREDFDAAKLGPEWLMLRTPKDTWYSVKDGALQLQARPVALGSLNNPSFVGRRQQHGDATATISLTFDPKIDGERAGLAAYQAQNNFYFLGIVRENGQNQVCVSRRQAKDEAENGVTLACQPAPQGKIALKTEVRGGKISFAYATTQGQWTVLLKDQDATVLSSKKACCFVGTVIGPYAFTPK